MFAYCMNNPVNNYDVTGYSACETAAKTGLVLMVVGVLMLATAATGGGALALAAGGTAALASAANVTFAAGAAVTAGSFVYAVAENLGDTNRSPTNRTSAKEMQRQVRRNQAPKDVDHVDTANPDIPGHKDHVHFKDKTVLNYDGTVSHEGKGIPYISRAVREWLLSNGWSVP